MGQTQNSEAITHIIESLEESLQKMVVSDNKDFALLTNSSGNFLQIFNDTVTFDPARPLQTMNTSLTVQRSGDEECVSSESKELAGLEDSNYEDYISKSVNIFE